MNNNRFQIQMPEPLIPLLECFQQPTFSAREFYKFLEFDPRNYSHWIKANLLNNDFAIENEDWVVFVVNDKNSEIRPSKDYALAVAFAKKLAMKANTAKGEKAREYFLACERVALQALVTPAALVPVAPANYPAALRALADSEEARLAAETRVAIMEPKAALFDRAMDSADLIDMQEVSRVLDLKNCGRNRIFEPLRDAGVIARHQDSLSAMDGGQPPILQGYRNHLCRREGRGPRQR